MNGADNIYCPGKIVKAAEIFPKENVKMPLSFEHYGNKALLMSNWSDYYVYSGNSSNRLLNGKAENSKQNTYVKESKSTVVSLGQLSSGEISFYCEIPSRITAGMFMSTKA